MSRLTRWDADGDHDGTTVRASVTVAAASTAVAASAAAAGLAAGQVDTYA